MLAIFNKMPLPNDPASGLDNGLNFAGYRFNAPLTLDNRAYVFKADVKLDRTSAHNLSVRATVLETRRSRSKPDRGIVYTRFEVLNQRGEVVMSVKAMNMLRAREPESV